MCSKNFVYPPRGGVLVDFISQHADNQKRNKKNKLVSLFFVATICPLKSSFYALLAGV